MADAKENLYGELKFFQYGSKLDEVVRGEVTPPLHIRLKPINACNHHCFWCCYRADGLYMSQNFGMKDMIPREKMREIVRDLGAAKVRAVTFTGGGEPLTYPWIDETLIGVLEHGMKVAVLTNGARLKGETAEILGEGASWVRVSIDAADGKTLAESRSVKLDEFDRIKANIREFARTKKPDCELGVNFIVTQLNAQSTYDFIAQMKDCGADHVKISECVVSVKGEENTAYHAPHGEFVRAEVQRAQADMADEAFGVFDKFHEFATDFDKEYSSCPFLQFLNVVAADQVVYSCQDKAYTPSGALGSIKDQSLAELWASPEYAQRVRELNPAKVCDHHCVAHGKNQALHAYQSATARHVEFV